MCAINFLLLCWKEKKDQLFSMRIFGINDSHLYANMLFLGEKTHLSSKNKWAPDKTGDPVNDPRGKRPDHSSSFSIRHVFHSQPSKGERTPKLLSILLFCAHKEWNTKEESEYEAWKTGEFFKAVVKFFFFPPSSHGEEKEKRNISVQINGARICTW